MEFFEPGRRFKLFYFFLKNAGKENIENWKKKNIENDEGKGVSVGCVVELVSFK